MKAKYIFLYEKIRDEIIDGIYCYGDKLPSKRTQAEQSGNSPVTVEHAYALLCDEGYIEAKERSGYYVCYRPADTFTPTVHLPLPFLPVDRTVLPDFPFSVFARIMRQTLSKYGERILIKCPNKGCVELRSAISRYLARSRGIHANIEQIIIGSGAEYLYGLLIQLLGRERLYAIESPSYDKIEQVYAAQNAVCDLLPLDANGIVSEALNRTGASVLHVTPYRSFPSGVTASASKRNEYLSWVKKGDRLLIEDDFESEFSPSHKPQETLFSADRGQNVIYMNTFSMTISPSVRIAYLVLPPSLLPSFEQRVGFYSCTVPSFEQFVLAEFIEHGDFERHLNRVRRKMRKNKR